ncbi:MAG: MFS transporter [Clostridia bacterium]|nr:MFS transporter [Clostridia bacterium]
MRKNFSVMLAAISESGFDAVALGAVGSAMTIAYGGGQIINGILGDKFKPQNMLTVGLILATVSNFTMYFCTTIPLMTAIWFVNGFAHSMLWPPIVNLMAAYMNDVEYERAAIHVYGASSIATVVLYILSPVLLKVMDWRGVILCIAAVGVAISALWLILSPGAFKKNCNTENNDDFSSSEPSPSRVGERVPLPAFVFLPTALIFVAIVLHGALRDGVSDWMPTFMQDAFGLDSGSAIITGILPAVFGMVSVYVFDILHSKLFRNEVLCAAVIFVIAALSAAALLLINVFMISGWACAAISAFLIGILVACMHGINLMLITIVPKRFIKSGRVSTFSGLLNMATYIGAAIALPLFPYLKDNFSWNATIAVWAVISIIGIILCFAATPMWKRFKKEYSDNSKA